MKVLSASEEGAFKAKNRVPIRILVLVSQIEGHVKKGLVEETIESHFSFEFDE